MLRTATLAAVLGGAAIAAHAQTPLVDGRSVNAPYWKAKAQCWRDLAKAEASQGDTGSTAATSAANADAITAALASGVTPKEAAIFTRKILPADDRRYGRPRWRNEILQLEAALGRYAALRCKTPISGCLEVAVQSVYENMEETQGARWNHGRPELDKALALAGQVDADVRSCELPPEPIPLERPMVVAEKALPADVLFAFDSAILTAAGSKAVASLVDELVKHGVPKMNVIGHTDRFGSEPYNAKLSLRRAEAVKAAILARVPGAAITTTGSGSKEPVATCAGTQTATTVACLAPNRRVVLQVLE
jgi:OOP family OmpA-OmpF porin